ncbi:MAG: homoserine kinase [Burkholderiales bacterium]|nr:homoserine kinase [Burkholderiales bacterium]
MAVFTPVGPRDLAPWLAGFEVGECVSLDGIASGIENSNFFLTTTEGEFVLTVFEKLSAAELPFYLDLTEHLSARGIPCPGPVRDRAGRTFSSLKGKPAAIVRRLPGRSNMAPEAPQIIQVGRMLARMHLAGTDFGPRQDNPRGPHWWAVTAPQVLPFLGRADAAMLADEMEFQTQHRFDRLPRGPIHADLFRDNVLFDGDKLGGLIDFYFAGWDCLLFDVAVCVNDWCIERSPSSTGRLDAGMTRAFLAAYHAERQFDAEEAPAWPVILRAAALRFWLSRLYDMHLPRAGTLVHPHDPEHFGHILRLRRADDAPQWL